MENLNVNAIETIIRDRRSLAEMFSMKFNEWLPKDRAFHTGFALQVLMGQKKLLKLTEKGSQSIPKTKETPELDKPNLFRIVNEDNELMMYIPNNSKSNYISLEFYHSLLFHKKRGVFDYLYSVFENKKRHASESIKKTMNLQMPSEVTQKLFSYKSNFDIPKSKPFFQLKRYKGLFDDDNNRMNNLSINVNHRNHNDLGMIMENNNFPNNEINNVNQIVNRQQSNLMNSRQNENNLYEALIKGIVDYMFENNVHNIEMAFQYGVDKTEITRKIIRRLAQYHRYDSFRMKNLDDQVDIVNSFIDNILHDEAEN